MNIKQNFKKNRMKFMTVLLFLLVGAVLLFWGTLDKTSDSGFCASCHNMKPEVYTWQASSHSKVECVSCHEPPGTLKRVEYKLFSVKQLVNSIIGDGKLQIVMTNPISDEACKTCHNMSTRQVSPSGDIIIPHDKHEQEGVACSKCHAGVAHGKIAEKRVTLRTDYSKWDETMGSSFMNDKKSTRPDMDTCMKCHQLRNAPLKCSACHKTSMLPDNHKTDVFKDGAHGKLAAKDITYCDSCHKYMSKQQVQTIQESKKYEEFLGKATNKTQIVTASSYAKVNTFCKDCHGQRPPSHRQNLFIMQHGELAQGNKDRCFTCHDNKVIGDSPVTKIVCGSCHPSAHAKDNWRPGHPVELPARPQVTELCYTCHVRAVCSKCHPDANKTSKKN